MAVRNPPSFLQNITLVASGHTAQNDRLSLGAAFAPGAAALSGRSGVLPGPAGGAGEVSVLSNTLARVKPFRAVIQGTRSALQGQYLVANDADVDLAIAATAVGVVRKDLVVVNVRDSAFSPDTLDSAAIQVVTGTAVASSPAEPTLGGVNLGNTLVLGVLNVPATGGTVTFTPRADLGAVAAGGIRSAAAADTGSGFYPLEYRAHPTEGLQQWNGTRWARAADWTIGEASYGTIGTSVAGTPTWTDLCVVTGNSLGGPCSARWDSAVINGASGADRTASVQVTCDGAVISSGNTYTSFSVPLSGSPNVPKGGIAVSTPAAGAHTWRLQANASIPSAVITGYFKLAVVERP